MVWLWYHSSRENSNHLETREYKDRSHDKHRMVILGTKRYNFPVSHPEWVTTGDPSKHPRVCSAVQPSCFILALRHCLTQMRDVVLSPMASTAIRRWRVSGARYHKCGRSVQIRPPASRMLSMEIIFFLHWTTGSAAKRQEPERSVWKRQRSARGNSPSGRRQETIWAQHNTPLHKLNDPDIMEACTAGGWNMKLSTSPQKSRPRLR